MLLPNDARDEYLPHVEAVFAEAHRIPHCVVDLDLASTSRVVDACLALVELPLGRFAAPSEKSAVGGNIDEIVFRALEKERSRRQQSVNEFKTQVEGVSWDGSSKSVANSWAPFEYKSKRMVFGMPLLHVVHGTDPVTSKVREARGVFAVSDHRVLLPAAMAIGAAVALAALAAPRHGHMKKPRQCPGAAAARVCTLGWISAGS